jgi:hypothetical protein
MKVLRIVIGSIFCAGLLAACSDAQQVTGAAAQGPVSSQSPQPQNPGLSPSPATTAAASTMPAKSEADVAQAVRERSEAYYAAFLSGDRAAAEQIVAPESKPAFRQLHLDSLVRAKVSNVEVAATGDSATVTVMHTYRLPDVMDLEFHQSWKRIDGQWYLVFPVAHGETATPFGTMNFSGQVPDQAAMEKLIEERSQHVDPDQFNKALAKVAATMQEQEAQQLAAAQRAKDEADAKAKADAEKATKTKGKKKSKKSTDDSKKSDSKTAETQKPPDQTRNQ